MSAFDGSDVLDGLKVFEVVEVLEMPDGHKAVDGLCMVLIN